MTGRSLGVEEQSLGGSWQGSCLFSEHPPICTRLQCTREAVLSPNHVTAKDELLLQVGLWSLADSPEFVVHPTECDPLHC